MKKINAEELETQIWYRLQSTFVGSDDWCMYDGHIYDSEESVTKGVNGINQPEDGPQFQFRCIKVTHREEIVGVFEKEAK
jgi:hypothetical protein